MRNPRRRTGPIAALVVLAMLVASCSGSDAPTDARGPTSATQPTAETSEEAEASESSGQTDSSDEDEQSPASPPTLPPAGDQDSMTTTDRSDSPSGDTAPQSIAAADMPSNAADLIAAIDEAELAIRAPGIDEATAAPWGRRQQALYGWLSFNPEWAAEVLAGVDPSITEAVRLNWEARQSLIALVLSHTVSDTLPTWRIEPPAPADELLGYYKESEEASGVPWEIMASINLIETRMGRIQGISTAGAVGPMQFLPTTWAECCEGDATSPHDAILGAGKYLVDRGARNDLDRAIFGYNNSDHYVTAVRAYAAVLEADERAYYGYHAWLVYFLTTEGVIILDEDYEQLEPIAATAWLADHPETLFAP